MYLSTRNLPLAIVQQGSLTLLKVQREAIQPPGAKTHTKRSIALRTLLLAERLKKLVPARLLVVAVAGCSTAGGVSVGAAGCWP